LKRGLIKFLYPFLVQRADKIVFNSIEAAADFHDLFHTKQVKTSVIHNFCDIGKLKTFAQESFPKDYIQIFKRPVIITSGRLIHAKGQCHLLRAFKSICQRNNELHLVILGEGPLKAELLELCQKLHIQDRVFLPGFQPNPMPWIAKADLFVLPSLAEGFPNALLEAMALGVPVISTDCWSGPREILAPDTDPQKKTDRIDFVSFGLLTPPLDGKRYLASEPLIREEELLAEAIEIMLKDSSLRLAYSRKAIQRATDFSEEKAITQWMKLIEEVMENTRLR
jgi:glycosyltransferase involved in cell wall biosynthesis